MFKINTTPQLSNDKISIEKNGYVLTINENSYDFSSMNDGDIIPSDAITNKNIIGSIIKNDGIINITIIIPYSDPNSDEKTTNPNTFFLKDDGKVIFND